MMTPKGRGRLEFMCAISIAAALEACAFPNDGSRDDVGQFDATVVDTGALDAQSDTGADVTVDRTMPDGSLDVGDANAEGGSSDVVLCPPDAGASFQVCGAECVNTATSTNHCGRCDNSCGLGTDCVAGSCNLRCSPGTVRCGTACIDPTSNPEFCNANDSCTTFTPCMTGQSCVNGTCTTNCASGSIFCGGRCVDPSNNPQFCGASGNCMGPNAGSMCTGAQVCSGGACLGVCPMGTIDCGGSCVDPLSSRMFCGASGNCMGPNVGRACMTGEVCVNRVCRAGGCATGTIRCGDSCVDPQSNALNCGARGDCLGANAGTRCGAFEQCISGTCAYAPPPASYLATAIDDRAFSVAAPVNLRLSAPQTATFYYTLDGSNPSPGAMNTRAGTGRFVVLNNVGINSGGMPDCTRVRWYADYGAPLGRELETHQRTVCFDPVLQNIVRVENRSVSPYDVTAMDELTLTSGAVTAGAVIVVDPGARVELGFRLRQFTPIGVGNRQILVFLETPTRAQLLCHWVNDVRNETFRAATVPSLGFNAPMAPGRYAIRWNHAPGASCTVPSPLELRTIAVVIVR